MVWWRQGLRIGVLVVCCALFGSVAISNANTSHAGWPAITGMLLMNKLDQDRPLDGRPEYDPFDETDPSYSCDGLHRYTDCSLAGVESDVDDPAVGHNELLGGHGNDTIHAGPSGDVIWGDFKPSGQPTTQRDALYGGSGKDFIYASHGTNEIVTGGGNDIIHAHFGRGRVTCTTTNVTVFISRVSLRRYRLRGCKRISFKTLGY